MARRRRRLGRPCCRRPGRRCWAGTSRRHTSERAEVSRSTPAEMYEHARDVLEQGIGRRETCLWKALAERAGCSPRSARRWLAKARAEAAAEAPEQTARLRQSMPYLLGEAIAMAREKGDARALCRACDSATRFLSVAQVATTTPAGVPADDPAAVVAAMAATLTAGYNTAAGGGDGRPCGFGSVAGLASADSEPTCEESETNHVRVSEECLGST